MTTLPWLRAAGCAALLAIGSVPAGAQGYGYDGGRGYAQRCRPRPHHSNYGCRAYAGYPAYAVPYGGYPPASYGYGAPYGGYAPGYRYGYRPYGPVYGGPFEDEGY